MTAYPGIAAARSRSDGVDALVAELAPRLAPHTAAVALGAYGRRELTPRGEVELLFLHTGELTTTDVTQVVAYPLWEQAIRVDTFVRTVDECAADARRSWAAATRLLDARLITGDSALFDDLEKRMHIWSRDRTRLRHRLRTEARHRHLTHPAVTASSTPDLVAGRGGLLDLQALRWLDQAGAPRTLQALDCLLLTVARAEELLGHTVHRLAPRVLERLDPNGTLLEQLHGHARWVAFTLDSALGVERDDRQLGPMLAIRRGELVADRPPPLERAPDMGLRIANVVGMAPPSTELLEWAQQAIYELPEWDEATREQFWLLLRAADWRAWEFLDVTGLLTWYLPELESIRCKAGSGRSGGLAVDHHSFQALRSLHEWTESDDPFARRAWRGLRQRDRVYLAVLLHELAPEVAAAAAHRVGLGDLACDTLKLVVGAYQLVLDSATRRDLHDEDLLLELATRIGSRNRLSTALLVAVAHEMASGDWSPWKGDLLRQLFGHLEAALGKAGEVGTRKARSLEQHRERITRELERRGLYEAVPLVGRLPRRYVLAHTPAFVARHLALLGRAPLGDGEVRLKAMRRQAGVWDVQIVARDRPGLLAMVAGVLALRGASVLGADAATSADGLVLDTFTVTASAVLDWSQISGDLRNALEGRIPLHDLLGSRAMSVEDAALVHVGVDNQASSFFTLVEVRAPDEVGLLYRIASAFHAEGLDIHHARIATYPEGALDVFYVRDLGGEKLGEDEALRAANALTRRLRGAR